MVVPWSLRSTWSVAAITLTLVGLLLLTDGGTGPSWGQIVPASSGGSQLLAGDLDRDSRPELLVVAPDGVSSYSDTAGSTASGYHKVATVHLRTPHLTLSDVDGDGDPDLYGASGAAIASGTSLQTTGQYRGGWWMGDLDGDGRADRVDLARGNLSVDLTNIAGGAQSSTLKVGEHPISITVTQVDGLGGPDILVLNGPAPKKAAAAAPQGGLPLDPSILLNRAQGVGDNVTMLALLPSGVGSGGWARFDCPVGADPIDLGVGDINGDKLNDLVTLDRGAGTVTVRLGGSVGQLGSNPLGLLAAARCLAFPTTSRTVTLSGAVAMAVGDLDEDGFDDVVSLHQPYTDPDPVAQRLMESSIQVWYGSNGTLDLVAGPTLRIDGAGTDITVADLDGDEAPEIVVLTTTSLLVIPNDGDGRFVQPTGALTPDTLHGLVVGSALAAVAIVIYGTAPRVRRRRIN